MSLVNRRREALAKGLSRGDKIKIGLLAVGLVLVAGVVLGFYPWGSGEGGGATGDTSGRKGPIDNEPASAIEVDTDGTIRAHVVPETADVLGPEKPVDPAKLESVKDDSEASQTVLEAPALDYLLDHVFNEASIRRKVSGFQPVDPEVLLASPSRYRGLAVEFKGKLLAGRTIPYADHVADLAQIYRGYLEVLPAEGEPEGPRTIVSLTYPGTPEVKEGDVVRIQGFFLKTWRVVPLGRTAPEPTPHVVVRRLIESFVVVPQTVLDPFWFTAADGSNLDEQPFWLLLNYVEHLTPETYRARKADGKLETRGIPEPGTPFPEEPVPASVITDFGDRGQILNENHERFRGRLVRVTGVLYLADPVAPGDNPGGVERYWDCWLAQDRYLIPFVTPFPLDRFGVKERDIVQVEGYLYKRRSWDNMRGERLRAPFLVATDITRERIPESPIQYLPVALVIVGVVFVVVLGVMLFLDRRGADRNEERRRKIRGGVERRPVPPPAGTAIAESGAPGAAEPAGTGAEPAATGEPGEEPEV